MELYALQESFDDIKKLGAKIVAVTPQIPELSAGMVEKHELEFDVLSDCKGEFTESLNINFDIPADLQEVYMGLGIDLPACSGEPQWVLPIPARIVIDSGGIVRATDIDPDYTVRPEASKTVDDLRALNS